MILRKLFVVVRTHTPMPHFIDLGRVDNLFNLEYCARVPSRWPDQIVATVEHLSIRRVSTEYIFPVLVMAEPTDPLAPKLSR